MKILEVEFTRISLDPMKARLFSLAVPFQARIRTDEGTLVFSADQGFITDMRSGGKLVDWLIDHTGSQKQALAWLCHDIAYHPDTLSFHTANVLMRELLLFAGVPRWKANLVFDSVENFGYSHHTASWEEVKAPYTANRGKYKFRWVA